MKDYFLAVWFLLESALGGSLPAGQILPASFTAH
jgi:hypothetical protein